MTDSEIILAKGYQEKDENCDQMFAINCKNGFKNSLNKIKVYS
jgi:hypothetical protein